MAALNIWSFYLPKAGNEPKEYEDAFAYSPKQLVIADGASQGFESKKWATSLVSSFKKLSVFKKTVIENWLEEPINNWNGLFDWDTLPINAAEKARRGAFSTLLGMDFDNYCWQAMAVGDSCMFQIRKNQLIVRFPIEASKDFDYTPDLLSTRKDYNSMSLDNLKIYSGDCKPNDLFVLATDALSEWFLRQVEEGEKPWNSLFGLAKIEMPYIVKRCLFNAFINFFRNTGKIRNDDVTVILAEYKE